MKASINRTATFAWSPATYESESPLIATGTVAGALDESFSNESVLELWQPSYTASASVSADAKPLGSISTSARFNRLAWGYANPTRPKGLLAAGLENGELGIWDAEKILADSSESDAQVIKNTTHTGPVRGLDFNPLQPNLLSSGAVAGEIFIWDLNAPAKPYSPGARSQKLDEITSLAWNCQVPHVLATSSSSGYTVVWDLRGKREVVALQYGGGAGTAGGSVGFNAGGALAAGGRRGMSAVAWHPDHPTRLVTASEDDSSPVIMLWDLKNSRAPEKIMTGHDKGVLSLSWCKQDADLLLSCGKDNRSILWNPQSCEIVGELPSSSNWSFEVQWSPRNPAMLATASFDGKIGVHSLQSTNAPETEVAATQQAADGSDFFNQTVTGDATSKGLSLKQPPKWLRRPVSAVFGFGGQLVSSGGPSSKPFTPTVHLRNLVSEPSIVDRATKLQQALDGQSLAEFCAERSQDSSTRPDDIANWKALQTLFRADSRDELVALLGFSKEDVAQRVSQSIAAFKSNGASTSDAEDASVTKAIDEPEPSQPATSAEAAAESQAAAEPAEATAEEAAVVEPALAVEAKDADEPSLFGEDAAGAAGNNDASDFFSQLSADQPSSAIRSALPGHLLSESQAPVQASAAATAGSPGPSSVASENIRSSTFKIYPSEESEGDKLITRALVLGDFESAVSVCINSDRFADAFLLAVRGGEELLAKAQKAYFQKRTAQLPYLRLFQSIVSDDLSDVVQNADLSEWQEIFVVLCTFAKQDEFSNLTEQLGQRLEFQYTVARNSDTAQAKEHRKDAVLCYLAAGKLEKVAGMWIDEMKEEELALRSSSSKGADASSEGTLYSARAEALQTFMEKITVFQSAVGYVDVDLQQPTQDSIIAETGARSYKLAPLYDRIHEYVELLADQGLISPALRFANQTPSDYRPQSSADQGANGSLTATALKQRLLKAETARPKDEAAAVTASNTNGFPAATASTSAYAAAPVSNGYTPYDPYGQSAPSVIPSIPTVPSLPAVPTYQDPYAAAAPAVPAAAAPSTQPATQSRYAPAVPAPVPTAIQPEPVQQQNNAYGGGYGAQSYQSAYQPAQPMIPGPPSFGGPSYQQQQQQQQLPPPPPLKRDQSGWNDVPEGLAAPKRTPSAMAQQKPNSAITSPFPNAPAQAPSQYGGAPGAPPAGPPRGATPSRGMMSPPPQGPPSGPGLAQQRVGPPGVRPPPPSGPMQGQARPMQQQQPYGNQAPGQPGQGAPSARPYARPPAGPGAPYGNGMQQQQQPPQQQQQQYGAPPAGPGAGALRPPGQAPPGGPGLAGPPGMPQRSATPGGGAGAPPRSATPGARNASQMKYPPGDRSHIPENQRAIQHALQREVARLKQTAPPAQKRMVDDTERRINLLLDHLNCGTIDAKTIAGLMQIVGAIEARNKPAALNIHLQLVTSSSGDVAAGLVGVKMIISRL
ncbi:Steroid receptor RNA activator-protein/coat protein complex II, Sec31 [Kalmanozyma brasiliensis GHG001]|uniref:Protein transport protein SEC31 n=1 Tax=Kalmanozyma brasiliensis (strain GHG001) TaxID=1365824 RepID=V5GQC4_KALBG|nr:Steroid receptor RNA activator-protein/coat protein complex II, Sec31 [Kalmanozyma brasiliensis GHG001]EST08137.1 Steroid receptor RNA activator-protein/coat protein complex II, Sec31 [Kalmanozyma brasiliensis GHG001]